MIARLRAASAEDRLLLIGLPLLVAALLIGWTVWVRGAALDDVEARLLTWPTVLRLTAEHLALVGVSTVLVVATAVPLGVLLSRPAARRFTPVAMGLANAGQAAPVIGVIVLLAMAWGLSLIHI